MTFSFCFIGDLLKCRYLLYKKKTQKNSKKTKENKTKTKNKPVEFLDNHFFLIDQCHEHF